MVIVRFMIRRSDDSNSAEISSLLDIVANWSSNFCVLLSSTRSAAHNTRLITDNKMYDKNSSCQRYIVLNSSSWYLVWLQIAVIKS